MRQEVVHVLGTMKSDESLALLKKMSSDDDKDIRNEAIEYLKSRSEQPATPTRNN